MKGPDPLVRDWMDNLITLVKTPSTWNFGESGLNFNLFEINGSVYSIEQVSY